MTTSRPGLELPVGLHRDAAAQIVQHQRLVRLRQSQLPGKARMLDAGLRRGAGAAVMAADQDHVGMALGHASRNGADADFRDQLDADARLVIGVFQVMDQLRQIFDGVDVVVRRRRNQTYARRRVPHFGDPGIDLAAGQLAPFAWLGALGHLDLQLPRLRQVVAGHAKATRGHLLNGAVARIAVGVKERNAPGLRRPRRYCSCRRCGSWQSPASRGLLY